jgi:hypothetical protein
VHQKLQWGKATGWQKKMKFTYKKLSTFMICQPNIQYFTVFESRGRKPTIVLRLIPSPWDI